MKTGFTPRIWENHKLVHTTIKMCKKVISITHLYNFCYSDNNHIVVELHIVAQEMNGKWY